jgi:hypothetical protein
MAEQTVDTERVSVNTYVPAYQREKWDDHAEELDMSRSEFLRTMVQAGRRHFDPDSDSAEIAVESADAADDETTDERPAGTDTSQSAGDLEKRVVEILETEQFLTWDQLVAELTDDIEERLETTLEHLQSSNRIRYSGRNGGYTLEHE